MYRRGDYKTRFTMNGRQPNTLRSLLGNGRNNGIDRAPADMPGVVVGVVTNADDKDGLGRVKVEFPWLGKDKGAWHRKQLGANFGADGGQGPRVHVYAGRVKDEVLVAFEHGDPNSPYILGGLWNTNEHAAAGQRRGRRKAARPSST